jgi:CubicO group peptidase (beta-lactamase class C family)
MANERAREGVSSQAAIRASGHADPAFSQVREVFLANFAQDSAFPEIGSAFSVYANGRCVVDLWAGVADPATGKPWQADTLSYVFSTSKGLLSLSAAQLVGQGKLSYDDRVSKHWPEFAANGKGDITVAQVLSHQAGLNGFDEPTTLEDLTDWTKITQRLADQAPFWAPGTETSYHATTFGFLIGEIIRRVSGLTPRDYIAQNLAAPLQLDVQVGAKEEDWPRIAVLTPPQMPPGGRPPMNPIALRAITNPMVGPAEVTLPIWRRAQVPAVNCHVTARSMARLWGAVANGGELDGVRILTKDAIGQLQKPLSTRPDLMMGPGAWGAGVLINRGGLFGPGARAFGNCGFGGSTGFTDPDLGIAASYTPNRLFASVLQDPRGMALAAAVAECAGRAGS